MPAVKPAYIDFSIDARVYLYLAGITFATAMVFGGAAGTMPNADELFAFYRGLYEEALDRL